MHYLFLEASAQLLTPKTNFNIGDFLNYWGGLLFSVTVILGVIWAVAKFFIIPPLKHWIKEWSLEVTKQIQPNANGGRSLTDANKKIDEIKKSQETLTSEQNKLSRKVDNIQLTNNLSFKHMQESLERLEKKFDKK